MLRLPALAGALALSCTLIPTMAQAKHGTYHRIGSTRHMTLQQVIHAQQRIIRFDQRLIARWESSRWVKVTAHVSYATPAALSRPAPVDVRYARAQLRWVGRELRENLRARTHVATGADMSAWLCIHRYEGSWTDPGEPYFGGLQMDDDFMATYGPEFLARWGTADHWPLWAQITAARRARDGYAGYSARGYHPWPNTARYCGLI